MAALDDFIDESELNDLMNDCSLEEEIEDKVNKNEVARWFTN